MKNWSGLLEWNPSTIYQPKEKEELIHIVQMAANENKKVRVIGSGHSFTPLCVTNEILINLDEYHGIIAVDNASKKVTVKSGTKLCVLNNLLDQHGLALENMGDIDVQSIAGAISTGTHGTGISFGNLSTQVCQIEFINGKGEIILCSENENAELFKTVQVSLGVMGILTEITIKCIDSYVLELRVEKDPIEDILQRLHGLNKDNRNFEFYWFPNTKWAMTKKLNIVNAIPENNTFKDYLQETILENYAFKAVCELSYRIPSFTHQLSALSAATVSSYQKTKKSFEVYSTRRLVRFNEMEYNIPAEAYPDTKKELMKWMKKNNKEVLFPVENRFVKKDDIYLSPAYERDSSYIAIHTYHKANHKIYFNAVEEIFKSFGGRPHWGKIHSMTQNDLAIRYPRFDAFNALRIKNDPFGMFLSPYLSSLFE